MRPATNTRPATVYGALLDALRAASDHNRSDMVAPVAVPWPDKEPRWEAVVRRLRGELPLVTLETVVIPGPCPVLSGKLL